LLKAKSADFYFVEIYALRNLSQKYQMWLLHILIYLIQWMRMCERHHLLLWKGACI